MEGHADGQVSRRGFQEQGRLHVLRLICIFVARWLGGFLVFHLSGALIQILLLLVVLSLLAHFVRRQTVANCLRATFLRLNWVRRGVGTQRAGRVCLLFSIERGSCSSATQILFAI